MTVLCDDEPIVSCVNAATVTPLSLNDDVALNINLDPEADALLNDISFLASLNSESDAIATSALAPNASSSALTSSIILTDADKLSAAVKTINDASNDHSREILAAISNSQQELLKELRESMTKFSNPSVSADSELRNCKSLADVVAACRPHLSAIWTEGEDDDEQPDFVVIKCVACASMPRTSTRDAEGALDTLRVGKKYVGEKAMHLRNGIGRDFSDFKYLAANHKSRFFHQRAADAYNIQVTQTCRKKETTGRLVRTAISVILSKSVFFYILRLLVSACAMFFY